MDARKHRLHRKLTGVEPWGRRLKVKPRLIPKLFIQSVASHRASPSRPILVLNPRRDPPRLKRSPGRGKRPRRASMAHRRATTVVPCERRRRDVSPEQPDGLPGSAGARGRAVPAARPAAAVAAWQGLAATSSTTGHPVRRDGGPQVAERAPGLLRPSPRRGRPRRPERPEITVRPLPDVMEASAPPPRAPCARPSRAPTTRTPEVNRARADLRAADEEIAIARSGNRPTVTAGRVHRLRSASATSTRPFGTESTGNATDTTTPTVLQVEVAQPLFRGFRTRNETLWAEATVRAERGAPRRGAAGRPPRHGARLPRRAPLPRHRTIFGSARLVFAARPGGGGRSRLEFGEATQTDVAQAEFAHGGHPRRPPRRPCRPRLGRSPLPRADGARRRRHRRRHRGGASSCRRARPRRSGRRSRPRLTSTRRPPVGPADVQDEGARGTGPSGGQRLGPPARRHRRRRGRPHGARRGLPQCRHPDLPGRPRLRAGAPGEGESPSAAPASPSTSPATRSARRSPPPGRRWRRRRAPSRRRTRSIVSARRALDGRPRGSCASASAPPSTCSTPSRTSSARRSPASTPSESGTLRPSASCAPWRPRGGRARTSRATPTTRRSIIGPCATNGRECARRTGADGLPLSAPPARQRPSGGLRTRPSSGGRSRVPGRTSRPELGEVEAEVVRAGCP